MKPSILPTPMTASCSVRVLAAVITLGSIILGTTSNTSAAVELITNGGFEQPIIFSSFSQVSTVTGWTLDPTSLGTTFEVRHNTSAYVGDQYIELNSGNTTSISQNLVTIPTADYTLSFAYSPRPGYEQNILRVYWNGSLLDTLSASGVGNADEVWTFATYNLTATSSTTHLAFDDLLETNALPGGMHLDAVSVQEAVPEPSIASILGVGLFGIWRRRRQAATTLDK